MKYALILASFLMLGSAQASYMATYCSNASGSVSWITGHNSNSTTLKYYRDGSDQEKVIPFYELETTLTDESVIFEERKNNCAMSSYEKIFSAKVVITAGAENPTALDHLYGEKKIETHVICETHINSRSFCP